MAAIYDLTYFKKMYTTEMIPKLDLLQKKY